MGGRAGGAVVVTHAPTVEPLTEAEADAGYALHLATAGDVVVPVDRVRFDTMVRAGEWVAARTDSGLVGGAYVETDDKSDDDGTTRWELGGLAADPRARGQGVGLLLARAATVRRLLDHGRRPVVAYVHQENHGAIRSLLASAGFAPTGRTLRVGPDRLVGHLRRDEHGVATADVLGLTAAGERRLVRWHRDTPSPPPITTTDQEDR